MLKYYLKFIFFSSKYKFVYAIPNLEINNFLGKLESTTVAWNINFRKERNPCGGVLGEESKVEPCEEFLVPMLHCQKYFSL